ncbi:hypothetical protein LTR04_000161 [Oleoguttula sp. CCFEE 6159]|nr:hypothetical protein LTR04_000161 [Oleoguttula sp. CCFEE 6159]
MGQGYSLTTLSAGAAGIDVPELADLSYEKSLGGARFMKTIRARHKDGLVVAKVVMKPYASMKLDHYVKAILDERTVLADVPNVLGYHRVVETSTNGYLVRQFVHSSLYDRMSTRPFLEDIEKKWLAFQLLCAVRDCHARNIFHGDIKTENTLVTSWNWLYLSDFSSSFKPTYLPEDNPADFSFYFDTSARRTCYVAPERFLSPGQQAEGKDRINWAMDIFSVGCVIAELFLEGPIFSLSQLFKYRKGEYDPEHAHLSKIEDKEIRELVTHMIQVDPESRFSADEYLQFWRRRAFPDYFYSFLHQYMHLITDPTSGRKQVTAGQVNLGESDDRIDRIYYDFDKISFFLGYNSAKLTDMQKAHRRSTSQLFPLYLDIPNNRHQASAMRNRNVDDGTLLFLTLTVTSVRSTARATARLRACELLLAFSERLTDEAKLDRVLPYVMTLLQDPTEIVRVTALRTLTQLLALVSVVSPINAYVFPEYILPKLQVFVPGSKENPSPLSRMTYASCLASLASTASRFLDMMQALRADGSLPTTDPEAEDDVTSYSAYRTLYDVAREDLVFQFEAQTKAFLTDMDSAVRRAFLGSVSTLCVFFGSAKASDVVLSHLNTYLNDKDWQLKCAFFETIVGVATYVGGTSLEEFILPLMVQSLTDPEESVVERVIRSFSTMAQLGLFQRSKTWELVDVVGRFTMHPNIWIREAAAQFISAATTYLSIADNRAVIRPLIKPYLRVLPSDLTELKILDALKKPLPRIVLELALSWAMKTDKGVFWKPAQQPGTFSFGYREDTLTTTSARELGPTAFSKVLKNEEDEQWLTRLRNIGMGPGDEFKLLALREYIWRVAHRQNKGASERTSSRFGQKSVLNELGISPQTVFFDSGEQFFDKVMSHDSIPHHEQIKSPHAAQHTIADALLDASTPVDDAVARRGRSHPHSQKVKDLDRMLFGDEAMRSKGPILNALPPPLASPGPDRDSNAEPHSKSLQVPRPRGGVPKTDGDLSSSLDSNNDPKSDHRVRHQTSAMNLMNSTEARKANAETSTDPTNAVGKLNIPSLQTTSNSVNEPLVSSINPPQVSPRFRNAHTYTGHDPTVLKMLDDLYAGTYPVDAVEFGPTVAQRSHRHAVKRAYPSANMWRPEGLRVAVLNEHSGPCTRIAVAPDHVFFITASDDGTIKVWDTARLEKNIMHRPRCTYKLPAGARVSSVCFVEKTHTFISTGTDGSVNVAKVDVVETGGTARYGKLKTLREWRFPTEGEHAVWSEHFKSDTESVLIMATNESRIVAIALRTMSIMYELENPAHHGTPTCFCLDRKGHWLLLGTSHGVLDLWDLRFQKRLKGWGFKSAVPVKRVMLHPLPLKEKKGDSHEVGTRQQIIMAGGTDKNEVTVWDLERMTCREVYRTTSTDSPAQHGSSGAGAKSLRDYEALDLDVERKDGMLGRFGTSVEPEMLPDGGRVAFSGLAVGIQGLLPAADEDAEAKLLFLLTAGPDWKIRFWDCWKAQGSQIVSGVEQGDSRPTYSCTRLGNGLKVFQELRSEPVSQERKKSGRDSKASRYDVVRTHQQHLSCRGHRDEVLDVALLEYPFGMIVSADRSGTIMVYK